MKKKSVRKNVWKIIIGFLMAVACGVAGIVVSLVRGVMSYDDDRRLWIEDAARARKRISERPTKSQVRDKYRRPL